MKKETYKIRGMHCASCVATIEHVLGTTAGVHSASVNVASESALIEFEESIISEADLAKIVESVGYHLEIGAKEKEVVADNRTRTISMKVVGMDSPHCAMVVEGALKKLPGIKNIDVDFSNRRATVVFDSSLTTSDAIFKVIADVGYTPIKEEGEAEEILDKEKVEREKQIKIMKRKLVVGGILSAFIFLGSFPEWFSFMPQIFNNNWTLLLLTGAVLDRLSILQRAETSHKISHCRYEHSDCHRHISRLFLQCGSYRVPRFFH